MTGGHEFRRIVEVKESNKCCGMGDHFVLVSVSNITSISYGYQERSDIRIGLTDGSTIVASIEANKSFLDELIATRRPLATEEKRFPIGSY